MKILFVRPSPSPETIGLQHVMLVEPLELEVLATLVGNRHDCQIVDMTLEDDPIETFIRAERPDLFCVTGYITNVPEMIEYCRIAKAIFPALKTAVGGVHCEVCPEDLDAEPVDFRIVRNATVTFPQLVQHLGGDAPLPAGVLRRGEDCNTSSLPPFDFSFPIPDRRFTARYRKRYFYIFHDRVALVKTSFGCPYRCSFCFCRAITKDNYFERPLDEVIRELEGINETNIYIVDDDFLSSRKRVLDFLAACRAAGLKKQYLLYGRADFIAANPDVMRYFAEVGLKTVIVGLESFDDKDLEQYNKHIDASMNETAMQVLNRCGIDCFATIIVPPQWDRQDFERCGEHLQRLGVHYVNLQPLTPLPGTDFTIDNKRLVIPRSDYHKWDLAHITVRPDKMGIPDFYRAILKLYHRVVFQPRFVFRHLRRYSLSLMWRMIIGTGRVHRQYKQKIREV